MVSIRTKEFYIMFKTLLFSILSFFILTSCTQAKNVDSRVYECVSGSTEHTKRCELKNYKNKYLNEEVKYYFQQVGKGKFEKEVREYAKNYVQASEEYCAMHTSFAFVDIPQDKNKIYEETASCLQDQYVQLGKNLHSMTDRATQTIIQRITKSP